MISMYDGQHIYTGAAHICNIVWCICLFNRLWAHHASTAPDHACPCDMLTSLLLSIAALHGSRHELAMSTDAWKALLIRLPWYRFVTRFMKHVQDECGNSITGEACGSQAGHSSYCQEAYPGSLIMRPSMTTHIILLTGLPSQVQSWVSLLLAQATGAQYGAICVP